MNWNKINNNEREKIAGFSFLQLFGLFVLLHALLFLYLRMYPFIDLSFHLAAATIYRHYNDADNFFKDYYLVDAFLKPNTFHMWLCSLPVFPHVEAGNKAFYIIYIVLLPLSIYLIIREIGGIIWVSFLALLMLYNYSALFGFVGYTFAIPVNLLIFYFFIRSLRTNSVSDFVIIGLLLMSLFFMHALVTLYAISVLGTGIFLCYFRSPLKIIIRLAVLVPVLSLIVYWWSTTQRESNTLDFLMEYYKTEFIPTFISRINFLYLDNINLYTGLTGNIVATLFSLAIYLPLVYALVVQRQSIVKSLLNPKILFVWVLFFSAFVCHFFLPAWLPPDEVIIYERFSVFLGLASILLLSIYLPVRYSRPIMYSSITAGLLHLILWGDFFIGFEHQNKFFTRDIFPDHPAHFRLAGLIKDYYYRRVHCYIMYPDFYITWKKGIGTTSAIDYRFGAVRRKVGTDVIPKFDHWMVQRNEYKGQYDQVEYILTKGVLPDPFVKFLSGYHLEKEQGSWSLYKKQ